jgi:hypothetical protein
MSVFEVNIKIQDGESEYHETEMISSKQWETAYKYAFNERLKTYFGSDTEFDEEEGIAWDIGEVRAAEIEHVQEMESVLVYNVDSKQYERYEYKLVNGEENDQSDVEPEMRE